MPQPEVEFNSEMSDEEVDEYALHDCAAVSRKDFNTGTIFSGGRAKNVKALC